MSHSAKVIAHSISPDGREIATLQVVMPRIVLAEFNTHRVFSRNSASSRAIPIKKMLKMVQENPYVPSIWGKNQKGMQAGELVDAKTAKHAERVWLDARDKAVEHAQYLLEIGIHKQLTNRLLEPFMWHTVVVTSTEWGNFYHQRDHGGAHPDIQICARLMKTAYEESEPKKLEYGRWHLPYLQPDEYVDYLNGSCGCDGALDNGCWRCTPDEHKRPDTVLCLKDAVKISTARCARVSYLTQEGTRDLDKDLELYARLMQEGFEEPQPAHMSPFEHPARPLAPEDFNNDELELRVHHKYLADPQPVPLNRETWCGNFRGWVQHRKEIPGEADSLGYRLRQLG
jgi:thymidylate synthase ThyX